MSNVKPYYFEKLQEISSMFSRKDSSKRAREMLDACKPPAVPYLGTYLSDLTFIEVGNSDSNENGLINFKKDRHIAKVIFTLQKYQGVMYHFQPLLKLQKMISFSSEPLKNLNSNEFWDLSKKLEP